MNDHRHPTEAELVLFVDGELDGQLAGEVKQHLISCWQCRTRAEELSTAIGEFVRFRGEHMIGRDADPPRPWLDLRAYLDDVDDRTMAAARLRFRSIKRIALAVAFASALAAGWLGFRGSTKTYETASPRREVVQPVTPALPPTGSLEVRPRDVRIKPTEAQPQTSVADELRALAALHGLGADLGEPISVTAADRRVTVRGLGIAPDRQHEIRSALAHLPSVHVQFDEPPARPNTGQPRVISSSGELRWQAQLEKALGSRTAVEETAAWTLNQSDTMLAHAHALRALDQRFAKTATEELSESDRALLAKMRDAHVNAIRQAASNLHQRLSPLLRRNVRVSTPPITELARECDVLLNMLFGGAETTRPYEELVDEIGRTLQALKGSER